MQKSISNCFVIIFFGLLLSICCSGQEIRVREDICLINKQLSQNDIAPSKRPFVYNKETPLIKKINPVGLLLGGSLYVYQNVLSKHISATCLFTPSCSEFGKQAIKEEGLLKGIILTADRLNRCNRIAALDLKGYVPDPKTGRYYDPVSKYSK